MWYRKEGSVGRKGGIGGTEGLARKVLRCKFKSACNKKNGGRGLGDRIRFHRNKILPSASHTETSRSGSRHCIYIYENIYISAGAVGTNALVNSLTPRNVF